MRLLTALACLLLAACGGKHVLRPAPPAKVITVYVPTYVPIPEELTAPCDWVKDADPALVFLAAHSRRKCLEEQYEPNLREIRGIQGTPVPQPKDKKP